MRHAIVFLISFLLLNNSIKANVSKETVNGSSDDNSISIFCSPDLLKLTTNWADEYCKLNPGIEISIIDAPKPGKAIPDNNKVMGIISGNYPEMYDGMTWNMVVSRDIMIPVFSSKNPYSDEICRNGISVEDIAALLKGGKTWGDLLKKDIRTPVVIYVNEDGLMKYEFAAMNPSGEESGNIVRLNGINKIITTAGNDPYSIGICGINDLTGSAITGEEAIIKLLPIDRNGNGKIDHIESIYNSPEDLLRGVWIGKYPKDLVTSIYAVSSNKPANKVELDFLRWILTGGQDIAASYGFGGLLDGERSSKVASLSNPVTRIISTEEYYASSEKPLLVLFITAIIILSFFMAVSRIIRKKSVVDSKIAESERIFDDTYVNIPAGLFYDKTHTWAFMEPDGMVKIGIDDFLQHVTGPITSIKMLKAGEKATKGKPVLTIISKGKQLHLYSPVTGTIREFNSKLKLNTAIINSSPYSEGWIYRIEPAKWLKEIEFLVIGNKYKDWLKSEFARLKEFLANTLKHESVEFASAMQDGGELKDGVLADLGPEIWEDFQTNFIDETR